jgi:cytochrome bd-type quinol oxidase subunit 1
MTRCTEKDVLLGRGKRVSEWPGNIHFRQVVNRYREEYATAERANKVKIAAAVIAAVQNVGGRFVREAGRSWYVVTHDRAVEKTCTYTSILFYSLSYELFVCCCVCSVQCTLVLISVQCSRYHFVRHNHSYTIRLYRPGKQSTTNCCLCFVFLLF